MDMQCLICHDHAVLPVQFSCFPCDCRHNIQICCMKCVHTYLQLEIHKTLRVATRRCLTCPMLVEPRTLYRSSAYVPHTLLWRVDTGRYSCPSGCGLEGSQQELGDHRAKCPHRIILCDCTTSVPLKDWEAHASSCDQCFQCPLAGCTFRWNLISLMSPHMRNHGATLCKLCKNRDNGWACSAAEHERHRQQDCSFEKNCILCGKHVTACEAHTHYTEHRLGMEKVLQKYNDVQDALSQVGMLQHTIQRQSRWIHREKEKWKMNRLYCFDFTLS